MFSAMWGLLGARLLLVLGICLFSVYAENDTKPPNINATSYGGRHMEAIRWTNLEAKLKIGIDTVFNKLLSRLRDVIGLDVLDDKCLRDLRRVANGVLQLEPWALEMVDASGKMSSGLLSGGLGILGRYHQCLDISAHDDTESRMFRGMYCAVSFKPPLPAKPRFYKQKDILPGLEDIATRDTVTGVMAKEANVFFLSPGRLGLCVPSTCRTEDINRTLHSFGQKFHFDVQVLRCDVKEKISLNFVQTSVISIFIVLIFTNLLATVLDMCVIKETISESVCLQMILAFSLSRNFKAIFNTSDSLNSLSCLYGLKFITMTWIILAHTYYNINYAALRNIEYIGTWSKDLTFQVVLNGTVSVDTFFLISSFLVSKFMVQHLLVYKKKLNWKIYILHRYWRLTPGMMAVVAISLLPYFNPGPLVADVLGGEVKNCEANWWTNLLYIQNFIEGKNVCQRVTWFVAVDFQLYLFSLVIFFPLARSVVLGLSINVFCILLCTVAAGLVTYLADFPPTMLFSHPDREQLYYFLSRQYQQAYSHMPVYGIGIFLGYLLATRKKIVLKPVLQVVGWLSAVTSSLAVLYGVYEWNDGKEPTVVEKVLYSSCHRVAWGLSISWVILTCATGHGGVVNRFLSWRGWTPLGRLTFMAFLLHMTLQKHFNGSMSYMTVSHYMAVVFFGATVLGTYLSSLGLSLIVESPCLALEKIFLKCIAKKPLKQT